MISKFIFCSLLAFSLASAQELISSTEQPGNFSDLYKIIRVIGGTRAAEGEFPHQVSLQFGSPPYYPYSHMCGGSIIYKQWILTAGHCVWGLPKNGQLIVKAGKNKIKFSEKTEQIGEIEKVFIHKNYPGGVAPFDIALIKLSNALSFNAFVQPIRLPEPNSLPRGNAVLSGWGSTSMTTEVFLPNTLQKVTLPIIDLNTCRQVMGGSDKVDDTNVCTGPLTGGYSSCNGDSGGPLIMENGSQDQRELVGVVSWGLVPCGGYGAAAVFVRVSAFVDWILEVTSANGGL